MVIFLPGLAREGLTRETTLSTLAGLGMRTAMRWGRSMLSMAADTFLMGEGRLLMRNTR